MIFHVADLNIMGEPWNPRTTKKLAMGQRSMAHDFRGGELNFDRSIAQIQNNFNNGWFAPC
jgi:hypothetical protein